MSAADMPHDELNIVSWLDIGRDSRWEGEGAPIDDHLPAGTGNIFLAGKHP